MKIREKNKKFRNHRPQKKKNNKNVYFFLVFSSHNFYFDENSILIDN